MHIAAATSNDDGQIGGKPEDRGGMKMAGSSESRDPPQYGRACQAFFSE